jgi:hypothetical protein
VERLDSHTVGLAGLCLTFDLLAINLAAVGSKTFDCLTDVSAEVTLLLRIQSISWFTVDPVLMRGSSWIG